MNNYALRKIIGRRFGIRPYLVKPADFKVLMGYFDMGDLKSMTDEDRDVFTAEARLNGMFFGGRDHG